MTNLIHAEASSARIDPVHVDEGLLVVDKPAGLRAVPGRGNDKQDCLASRVRSVWPDALVVHRLDEATSGLMVFGRGATAQRRLGRAFEQRSVVKRYVAVVHGLMRGSRGVIDLPLAADWPNRPRQRVDEARGRPALTRWSVQAIDEADACTRVELEPHTGRTHQLRVHLQAIGHPIVGDTLYGPIDRRSDTRLRLHAASLALPHPLTGMTCTFESPAPF